MKLRLCHFRQRFPRSSIRSPEFKPPLIPLCIPPSWCPRMFGLKGLLFITFVVLLALAASVEAQNVSPISQRFVPPSHRLCFHFPCPSISVTLSNHQKTHVSTLTLSYFLRIPSLHASPQVFRESPIFLQNWRTKTRPPGIDSCLFTTSIQLP